MRNVGLSYTTFDYRNLAATADAVDLDLANTGTMAGAEVALVTSRCRGPARTQLKGCWKLTLVPAATGHARPQTVERSVVFLLGCGDAFLANRAGDLPHPGGRIVTPTRPRTAVAR